MDDGVMGEGRGGTKNNIYKTIKLIGAGSIIIIYYSSYIYTQSNTQAHTQRGY